ncbi:hypothetical protein [Rhodococcus sp. W8901]|nr:hypothetical protein [Rhodococcus sp. W8901]QKT10112.1 hypothetical protein HUN07_04715 [Rhodococcus sp. W8901]
MLSTTMLSPRAQDLAGRRGLPLSAVDFEKNLVSMVTAALTAPADG